MGLYFKGNWRFNPPSDNIYYNQTIPDSADDEFYELILKITTQGNKKFVLEEFKSWFSNSIGRSDVSSSNVSWAQTDLENIMYKAKENAPLYIDAFISGLNTLENNEYEVPDIDYINKILLKHNIGYYIINDELHLREEQSSLVQVETNIDEEIEKIDEIHNSLKRAEELLLENRSREAVQESLWMLETISTIFKGIEHEEKSIRGKYFNDIVKELRKHHHGTTLEFALSLATKIQGYLSSPSGGGVRHGIDIRDSNNSITPIEGRLFCNLIRIFAEYLISEYNKLKNT